MKALVSSLLQAFLLVDTFLLEDWLDPIDVVYLDSAYCSASVRTWWLLSLQFCSKTIFKRGKLGEVNEIVRGPLLDWILKRSIQVTHLDLPRNFEIEMERGGRWSELFPRLGCGQFH